MPVPVSGRARLPGNVTCYERRSGLPFADLRSAPGADRNLLVFQTSAESHRGRAAADAATAARELGYAGFAVDYVEDRGKVRLGAVRLEGVRLIDNVE